MASTLLVPTSDLVRSIGIAWNLCVKTLESRYARSRLGLLWLVLTPIAMVGLYWSVFGLVMGVKWPPEQGRSAAGYIVPFMSGLTVYLYFAEAVSGALKVFLSRRNYVRKSPIPLWVLWLAGFMGATLLGAVNLLLLATLTLAHGMLTIKGVLWAVPVVVLIIALFGAFSLVLALIGPFAGDVANSLSVVLRFVFYSAPITYPLGLVPKAAQPYLWLNPLTAPVEMLRQTMVFGMAPSPRAFAAMGVLALVLMMVGWWLYGRVADAVRDVV